MDLRVVNRLADQIAALHDRGVDVIVATPGRLLDHMRFPYAALGGIEILVIDEADRMADMGFMPAVRRILDQTSDRRQTLLFSATLDGPVAKLVADFQHDPVRHEVGPKGPDVHAAQHHFWQIDRAERMGTAFDVVIAFERMNRILHIDPATGVTITAGANDSSTVTFTGTQAQLNDALEGLVYTPAVLYLGPDTLSIRVDDLGHNGSGGALVTNKTVNINVFDYNIPPVNTFPVFGTTSCRR